MAPRKKAAPKVAAETVLVLRTCAADMTSNNGRFTWPTEGEVSAPDWKPTAECGNGLHGWLWGEGDGSLGRWESGAAWLVVEVEASSIIDLQGKVKFPAGRVVFCGDRLAATTYLSEHGAAGRAIVGGTATAGYGGTATAGYGGTATAGDGGTATAGDGGTATAGDRGTATAGYGGTATAGDRGTATAGYRGTATAGYRGGLVIKRWDIKAERYRLHVANVGEDGIEANRPYKLTDAGLFVPADETLRVGA